MQLKNSLNPNRNQNQSLKKEEFLKKNSVFTRKVEKE